MKRKIFKSSLMLTFVLILVLALAGTVAADDPVPTPDGSVESVPPYDGTAPTVQNLIAFSQTIFGTDYVRGGCGGMRNTGACNVGITIAGVGSGTVNRAFLYWHGPTNTTNPAANASVTFAGNGITGANIGFSDNNCWGFQNSQAYIADVTAFVPGDGNYKLSGFGSSSVNTNGASLLVFFNDGISTNNRDIVLFHGNDSNINNPFDAPGWNVTLSGINYTSGTAAMELHVADGQTFTDDALKLNAATLVPTGPIFEGNSVPGDNNGPTGNGRLWDIRTDAITSFLAPGPNTLTLTTGVAGDCLSLIVAAINLPAGAAPNQPNLPPSANAGGPYSGDEGAPIALSGSASDPDGDALTVSWSYAAGMGVDAGAACTFTNGNTLTPSITCTDDGAYTATLTVDDGTNPPVSNSANLTVSNEAPDLTITTPSAGALYAINTAVNLSGAFSDQGTNDTHTCAIDWDDGAGAQAGTVSETAGSGTCTGSKSFASAGVYNIAVTVTDDDGGSDSESVMVVVYDPSAGFVTGGGWIDSPSGAYTPEDPNDADVTGKANFGFVSKYQKGATTPTGQTEFQFHAGNLNFHSSNYQWLVVAGAKAQFKGTGTVNGVSGYGFLLTATDGQISGGGGVDKFRIKIWEIASGTVIYDNAAGASEDIDAANPLAIGGGSIIIHKGK
jgi:hypothetical protein